MAVPSITPASMALFQRIPERLFGPLASQNRHGYWALLCHLHRRRFGPDAPLPPSYGFLQREITQEIEDHLKYADEWQPESGDQPDTPLNIRAIAIFNHLVGAGWFRLEKYGIEKTVNMAPAVSQLLTQLINFAETGPVFVSGKIRAIDAAVAQVHKGEASGDLLREAAEQCRNLLVYIRNTGTNVRDLMAAIGAQPTTAQYVRSLFYLVHSGSLHWGLPGAAHPGTPLIQAPANPGRHHRHRHPARAAQSFAGLGCEPPLQRG